MNLDGVVAVHESEAAAREFAPGIVIRELWREPGGRMVARVEIAAGACWPELDVHEPGPELVYVLHGEFHDGALAHRAGTFLHHPRGTSHWPQSRSGCALLVFYPDG